MIKDQYQKATFLDHYATTQNNYYYKWVTLKISPMFGN